MYKKFLGIKAPIYLDTNVLINFFMPDNPEKHKWAKKALFSFHKDKKITYISLMTLFEFWKKLLDTYIDSELADKPSKPKSIKEYFKDNKPKLLNFIDEIKKKTTIILNFKNINILPTQDLLKKVSMQRLISETLENHKYILFPMDKFHLTSAILAGARSFVTSDSDFESINIKDITIVKY